jgi:hypothetical protein
LVRGSKSDTEFLAERGFGQRIDFAERPALIIIDMLRASNGPAAPLGANLEPQLAAIERLLMGSCARPAGRLFQRAPRRVRRQGCRHLGAQDERRMASALRASDG